MIFNAPAMFYNIHAGDTGNSKAKLGYDTFSSGLIMEMKMEITGNRLFFNLQDLHNFTPTPQKITFLLRIHRNNSQYRFCNLCLLQQLLKKTVYVLSDCHLLTGTMLILSHLSTREHCRLKKK